MGVIQLPKWAHPDFISSDHKPEGPVKIDWSNPITRDLQFCFLPQNQNNIDLVTREVGASSNAPITHDQHGSAVKFTGNGNVTFTNNYSFGNGPFTIWTRAKWSGTSGNYQTAIAISTQDIGIYYPGSSSNQQMQSDSTVSSTDNFGGGLIVTSGEIGHGSVSWPGGSGIPHVAYLNSVKATGNNQYYTGPGNEIQIGVGQGSEYFNGNIYASYVWSRQLSDAEQTSLHKFPYQFFEPVVQLFAVIPGEVVEVGGDFIQSIAGYGGIAGKGGTAGAHGGIAG